MFTSARIQLTLWYLLIIMTISIAFSIVIYHFLSREVDRFFKVHTARIENQLQNCSPNSNQPCVIQRPLILTIEDKSLVQETKARIFTSLVFINSGILVLSGGLGYFLAGKTLSPIKEMVDDQNRFISDASHELKTPLTSLKTAMEVHLRSKKRNLKESDELIKESIEEVDKLQHLSESLLLLASYKKPQYKVELQPVLLSSVINKAVKRVTALAKKKRITINKDETKYKVFANSESLSDLFVILLDNAIKYSKHNTTIHIASKQKDSYIQVSVRDEGVGISPAEQKHIFERFYRADSSRSHISADGYGLGLSIAQEIIKAHRASMNVESVLNKGTTFKIKIPKASN